MPAASVAYDPLDAVARRTITTGGMMETALAIKMQARAEADNLPADHDMRTKAAAFDEAAKGYYATPQTVMVKPFMGCWARARRAWCDYTGERLLP